MSYDHTDVAPYLRCYATSVQPLDDDGQPRPDTHRLVQWAYFRPHEDIDGPPAGIIRPKGAGQGFEVEVATVRGMEPVEGDFRTRRQAERALRFAAAGMEVPS